MTLSTLEWEILSMATEDWFPLWNILQTVRSVFPDVSEEETREVAERAVTNLLDQGLIQFCYDYSDAETLDQLESRIALAAASSWELPAESLRQVCYAATEAGERRYFSPSPQQKME